MSVGFPGLRGAEHRVRSWGLTRNRHGAGTSRGRSGGTRGAVHTGSRVWTARAATARPKKKGARRPPPWYSEDLRTPGSREAGLPQPRIPGRLRDAMRSTPRGSTAGDNSPDKRDRQPFFCLYSSSSARSLCYSFRKRPQRKHSPPHADIGMDRRHFQPPMSVRA